MLLTMCLGYTRVDSTNLLLFFETHMLLPKRSRRLSIRHAVTGPRVAFIISTLVRVLY